MRRTLSILLGVFCLIALDFSDTKAQQPTQHRFIGEWKMTWGGSVANVEFRQDGTYWCDWICGRRWEGVWTYDQTKDTVSVAETVGPFTPGTIPLSTWDAALESGALKGVVGGVGPFELKK